MDSTGRTYIATTDFLGTVRLRRLAVSGAVDATFSGGVAMLNAMPQLIHPDAAGTVTVAAHLPSGGALVSRLTAAGAPDTSFSGDGSTIILPGEEAYLSDIIERADGSLLISVKSIFTDPNSSSIVALTSAGNLGTTWGPTQPQPGVIRFGPSLHVEALAMDGSNVVVSALRAMLRLTSTGAYDASFAGDGRFDFPEVFGEPTFLTDAGSLAVSGGAYYIGGGIVILGSGPGPMAVAKMLPTGALAPDFGDAGIAMGYEDECAVPRATRVIPAGSYLYALGRTYNCGPSKALINRFTVDGELDAAYGSGGMITIEFLGGKFVNDGAITAGMQSTGRIVIGTSITDEFQEDRDAAVFRLR